MNVATPWRRSYHPSYGDYWAGGRVRSPHSKMAGFVRAVLGLLGNRLQFALTADGTVSAAGGRDAGSAGGAGDSRLCSTRCRSVSIEGRLTYNSYIFTDQLRRLAASHSSSGSAMPRKPAISVITLGAIIRSSQRAALSGGAARRHSRPAFDDVVVCRRSLSGDHPILRDGGLRFEAASPPLGCSDLSCHRDFVVAWDAVSLRCPDRDCDFDHLSAGRRRRRNRQPLAIKLENRGRAACLGSAFAGIATISFGVFSASVEFGEQGVASRNGWNGIASKHVPAAGRGGDAGTGHDSRGRRSAARNQNDKGEVTPVWSMRMSCGSRRLRRAVHASEPRHPQEWPAAMSASADGGRRSWSRRTT